MVLSEYNSKELLQQYGITVPAGRMAETPEAAEAASKAILEDSKTGISSRKFVVKAQIAAGGRGLAGGVRFAATPSAVRQEAQALLGTSLKTEQTGPQGEPVNSVHVEAALDLDQQVFIAFALDLATGQPMLLASPEGGMEFEKRAGTEADIVKTLVLPTDDRAAVTEFLNAMGIADNAATDMILAARTAFLENDMTLLEINPFARTKDGAWVAIDAKITLDASASFRHPEFEAIAIQQTLSGQESEAAKSNINFVKLDGNLGVVVNGAGLGLATNDMIIDAKGQPANFMDIRTTATSFDIAKGVEILLKDPKVKVILLNVHGGGMTVCDTVAEGVSFAYSRADRALPCVARLAGVNADWGVRILKDRKVPAEIFDDMRGAVSRAVALAKGRG